MCRTCLCSNAAAYSELDTSLLLSIKKSKNLQTCNLPRSWAANCKTHIWWRKFRCGYNCRICTHGEGIQPFKIFFFSKIFEALGVLSRFLSQAWLILVPILIFCHFQKMRQRWKIFGTSAPMAINSPKGWDLLICDQILISDHPYQRSFYSFLHFHDSFLALVVWVCANECLLSFYCYSEYAHICIYVICNYLCGSRPFYN